MKNTVLSVAALLLSTFSLSAQEIQFRELTFAEAKKAAQEEEKPIFMDCYTTWCGPCKWMAANIFTQPKVAEFYNENFICVSFDMEKGEGKDIAKEYNIRAYPTLLYLDGEGTLLQLQRGAPQEGSQYIAKGKEALNPETTFPYMAEHKEDNFDNPTFMQNYLMGMGSAGMLEEGELERYFKQFPQEEWLKGANQMIFMTQVRDYENPLIQRLMADKELENEALREHLDRVVYRELARSYARAKGDEAKAAYAAKKERILNEEYPTAGEKLKFRVEVFEKERDKDWPAYCQTCYAKVKELFWDDANELNNFAWTFYEQTEDAKNLEMALLWAERAVELEPKQHHILDTYAHLLFVNGQAKKALEVENRAIEIAEEQGGDTESYEELVEKIEEAGKS